MGAWGWGGVRRFGRFGRAPRRPDQVLNDEEAEQDRIDHVVAREDARYDSMTDAEREKFYVHPGPWTRLMRFFGH